MSRVVLAACVVAALAALASAAPRGHHHRQPQAPRHPRAHSIAFHGVPHTFLSRDAFEAAAEIDPRMRAAAARHAQQPHLRDRSFYRAGSVVPMGGGFLNLGYYYVNITVGGGAGRAPQPFTMLLDTGSANLALPSPACPTCGSDPNRYDPAASPTAEVVAFASAQCAVCTPDGDTSPHCAYGDPFPNDVQPSACGYGISYGGGSSFLGGYLVNDVVTFGGYAVDATVVAMTAEYPNASFSTAPVDGILGLCHEWNAVNPTWAPTLFGQIVKANAGLPDLFGICLDAQNGGVIDVGYADANKYSGALQWIPQVQRRWYNLPLRAIVVGSTALDVPPWAFGYVNDQIGAFPDSGTSVILISPLAFQSYQTVMQSSAAYAGLPGVNGASNLFTGACVTDAQMGGQLNAFPTLHFEFAGETAGSTVSLPVPPSAYLLHAQGQYCLGVQGVVGIGAVLGDAFMQNFYIVHDRAGQRLGFAPVANCV